MALVIMVKVKYTHSQKFLIIKYYFYPKYCFFELWEKALIAIDFVEISNIIVKWNAKRFWTK